MTREAMPQRRRSVTFGLQWPRTAFRPAEITISIGIYPSGKLGEVFISAGKSGGPLEAATRDGAILLSLALQHGVPIETIQHAITREEDGEASSMLGAIIDAVANQSGEARGGATA